MIQINLIIHLDPLRYIRLELTYLVRSTNTLLNKLIPLYTFYNKEYKNYFQPR